VVVDHRLVVVDRRLVHYRVLLAVVDRQLVHYRVLLVVVDRRLVHYRVLLAVVDRQLVYPQARASPVLDHDLIFRAIHQSL
jgi:hypothetical protein